MKKTIGLLLCLLLPVLTGCTSEKKEPPAKPPIQADTAHLTAAANGLDMSVSREFRSLSAMNIYAKTGYEVVSVQVALENNSKSNVPISPDFVTLKMTDGTTYKYSPALTDNITSRAAFKKVVLPPDYRGGGLLIFEIEKGSTAETLTYDDKAGRKMTIKFPARPKTRT